MTITLAPHTEARLKEMAVREGREANALAEALLAEVLEEASADFEQSCAAVAEALASDPANDISLEEYKAQFEAERQVRQQRPLKRQAA